MLRNNLLKYLATFIIAFCTLSFSIMSLAGITFYKMPVDTTKGNGFFLRNHTSTKSGGSRVVMVAGDTQLTFGTNEYGEEQKSRGQESAVAMDFKRTQAGEKIKLSDFLSLHKFLLLKIIELHPEPEFLERERLADWPLSAITKALVLKIRGKDIHDIKGGTSMLLEIDSNYRPHGNQANGHLLYYVAPRRRDFQSDNDFISHCGEGLKQAVNLVYKYNETCAEGAKITEIVLCAAGSGSYSGSVDSDQVVAELESIIAKLQTNDSTPIMDIIVPKEEKYWKTKGQTELKFQDY